MEITPISPTWTTNYFNKVEYDTRVIKTVTKVGNDFQQETVYTYDKYGRLESTVVHKSNITEI